MMGNKFTKTIIMTIIYSFFSDIHAQNNSKFNFVIGANICNPHQLFEGQNNITTFGSIKPWGNIYGGLVFKKKYQLIIGNELNDYSSGTNYFNDLFVNLRYVFLRDTSKIRPYFETGFIINTFGFSTFTVNNQQSYHLNAGVLFNLNKIIIFDFGISQQYREIEYNSNVSWSNDKKSLLVDRFMVRTGLIFKVL